MSEMLPCAFCGSDNVGVIVSKEDGNVVWAGKCEECGAYGPHGTGREQGVRLWNERRGVALLLACEDEVLGKLVEAYNLFVKLPVLHKWHQQEFMAAVHQAQRLVLARPTLRGMMTTRKGREHHQGRLAGEIPGVVWAMTTESEGFSDFPEKVQNLARIAETQGYCNFWWHPDYGLFADAPNSSIEDDRVLLDTALTVDDGTLAAILADIAERLANSEADHVLEK